MGERAEEVTRGAEPGNQAHLDDDSDMDEEAELEAERIEADIDRTREQMSETVEAIGEKLDPRNVVSEAKETVREATIGKVEQMASTAGRSAQDTGAGLMSTIRANPIPAAMTAIGVGWLLMNRRQPYGYGSDARWSGPGSDYFGERRYRDDTGSNPADAVRGVIDRAGASAGEMTDRAGETVGDVREQVGEVAWQARSQVERLLDENPLVLGVAALAAGAIAGAALPTTKPEREVLGQARDTLIDRAESVTQDALRSVEQQAQGSESGSSSSSRTSGKTSAGRNSGRTAEVSGAQP